MKANAAFLILIAQILVTSPGCKKDDAPQLVITLLTKSVTGSETTTYTYDGNNRATGYSVVEDLSPANNYTAAYTYNSSGQLTEVLYNPANSIEDTKDVFFYNGNGQISKIETYYVTNVYSTLSAKYEADHSIQGKVSVYKFTMAGAGTPYLNTEFYLDANGNVERQLVYDASGDLIITTENSDFDNKKAASASLPQTGFVRNVNNYGTVTVTPTAGSPSVGTYTYEYDADGYPTKRTTNTGSTIIYEYTKK